MRSEGLEGTEGSFDLSYLGDSLMRALFDVLKAATEGSTPTVAKNVAAHVEAALSCISQGNR